MENEELISNIKSKHILNYIFNYIENKDFKVKLFLYSKKFQIKYDIKLIGLKEKYLKKINFDLEKYLFIEPNLFQKDILTIRYNQFVLEKQFKKRIENIIYDIFEDKEIKDIEEKDVDKIKDNEKLINIESPLFKILSKTKNFGKIFTIHISQKNIDEYKLNDNYLKFFDNLNKKNINYTSIFYNLKNINKINYLRHMNIDFNKIIRLTIEDDDYTKKDNNIKKEFKKFFIILFSINNIQNNLIYLNLKFKYCKVDSFLFEKINNFKLLKYLYIENIIFDEDFEIKLNLLKLLSIKSCKNIKLSEISNKNLKELVLVQNSISDIFILKKVSFRQLNKLDLSGNNISDINILEKVNFEKLKELDLSGNNISDINILEKVNFKELNKLLLSCNEISDINILEKVNFKNLNKLNLRGNKITDINILEKVNFEKLKELDLDGNKISDINKLNKIKFKLIK